MHWWKKFLSNFLSDKTMDEPTELHIEDHHKNELHEMKTRMIYQYPKGEFRFPLIKDQPGKPVEGSQKRPVQREQKDEKRIPEKRQNSQSSGEKTEQKRRKIEPKNSQPFEPTHIPSPIYGFNRPIERKENPKPKIPEFELTDFKQKTRFEKEDHKPDLEMVTEEEVFAEQPVEPKTNGSLLDLDEKNDPESQNGAIEIKTWTHNQGIGESLEESEEEIPELTNTDSKENDEASNGEKWMDQGQAEMAISEEIGEKEEQFFAEEVDETEKLTSIEKGSGEEMSFPKQSEFEAEPAPGEKIDDPGEETLASSQLKFEPEQAFPEEIDEIDELTEEVEMPEEKIPVSSQPDVEPGPAFDEAPMDGESRKTDEDAFEETAAAVEMTLGQETEATEPKLEEPLNAEEPAKESTNSKPRSQLPFNVLMLSQDRARWQRQREREKSKSEAVSKPVKETKIPETMHYEFPALSLLKPPVFKEENTEWLNEQTILLDETMENFNVKAHVVKASQGPSVTRFEVQPDKGVKVNKITNLSNDIKLSMAARDIRMEAPIPGTRSIGIELPNKESRPVQISEIIGKTAFLQGESPLTAALGLDISGDPVVTDLRKMPHGLIAGATGSGKSVCINSILVSLLYKARPDELKLMLIDPKMVELAPYNHIPHLVSPVITDVKAATAALKWAVDEMERRYELFVHAGVRDIGRFNELAETKGQKSEHLPYIVIIIDELADLMMVAPAEVEESICRIAQKARACGIHLLIATQRPSVDVITGLIKANVPTRIAFAVSSQVDSRTVIDVSGAEKLLGRGDMLFLNNGSVKPVRLQGTFVSDEEIDRVIEHVRKQGKPNYIFQQEELLKKAEIQENEDELLLDACQFVVKQGNASTSLLQRQFRIGYNRAARLMEMMEEQGVISGAKGSKPRDVLIKEADLDSLKDSLVH